MSNLSVTLAMAAITMPTVAALSALECRDKLREAAVYQRALRAVAQKYRRHGKALAHRRLRLDARQRSLGEKLLDFLPAYGPVKANEERAQYLDALRHIAKEDGSTVPFLNQALQGHTAVL